VSSFIKNVFPQPLAGAGVKFRFGETLAARTGGATAAHTDHAQSGVVGWMRVVYLKLQAAKSRNSQCF
jgi:hypothetical protein